MFQALLRSEARTRLNFSFLSRSANCQGVVQEGHLRVIGQDEIFRLEIRKVVSCLTTTRENFLHILEGLFLHYLKILKLRGMELMNCDWIGQKYYQNMSLKSEPKYSKSIKWPKIIFWGPIWVPKVSFWGFWGLVWSIKVVPEFWFRQPKCHFWHHQND